MSTLPKVTTRLIKNKRLVLANSDSKHIQTTTEGAIPPNARNKKKATRTVEHFFPCVRNAVSLRFSLNSGDGFLLRVLCGCSKHNSKTKHDHQCNNGRQ